MSNGFEKASADIHIGHGKTGSSAIQSYLAQSAHALSRLGVSYPFHKSFAWAREGRISSGNGRLLLNSAHRPKTHELFSDETLCAKLNHERLINIKDLYPGGLRIICYTRDFFDHAISAWGQNIKRSGYTQEIGPFIRNVYGGHLAHIMRWFAMQEDLDFSLKIFNYSRHKGYLVEHFLRETLGDVGVALVKSTPPSTTTVNRSLTLGEYELQRLMNLYFHKKTSTFVSDVLVDHLPEIKSERPAIPKKLYEFAQKKFLPQIEAINSKLPSIEHIMFEKYEDLNEVASRQTNTRYTFSRAQLEVYVKSIAGSLIQPDIGRLERMISRHDAGAPIDRSDAAYLASVLQLLRPENEDYAKAHSRLTASNANPHPNGMSRFLQAAKRVFRKP